jgi:hypothetical protein
MENSLIPPAQLWSHGITVDVVPKQYSDGHSLHGIHHPDENVFIPFHLHGCISYFSTRLPTQNKLQECRWVTFTSEAEWQPYSPHFKKSEAAMKSHVKHADPRHIHFSQDGTPIDGRSFGAVYTLQDSMTSSQQSLPVDPSIATFDFAFQLTSDNRIISATSSKEHCSP